MKTILWILGIIVVAGLGYWWWSTSGEPIGTTTNSTSTSKTAGTVVVSFTDAAVDMKNVSEVTMSVDKVELWSQSQGWVSVSSSDMSYELLKLNANNEIKAYATASVASDVYSRARVTIKDVVVKTKAGATATAAMPSKTLDFATVVRVEKDQASSVVVDVIADKSLHITTDGDYVFAPVLAVESKSNATVQVASGGTVTVSGGRTDAVVNTGMDLDGSMKVGFVLDTDLKIDVNTSGLIKIIYDSSFETKL